MHAHAFTNVYTPAHSNSAIFTAHVESHIYTFIHAYTPMHHNTKVLRLLFTHACTHHMCPVAHIHTCTGTFNLTHPMHIHTEYICTHTFVLMHRTCIYIYSHRHMHVHIYTHAYTYVLILTWKYINIFTWLHFHTCTLTHSNACITHAYTPAQIYVLAVLSVSCLVPGQ